MLVMGRWLLLRETLGVAVFAAAAGGGPAVAEENGTSLYPAFWKRRGDGGSQRVRTRTASTNWMMTDRAPRSHSM